MQATMTWEEIKQTFPDEWVAVVEYQPSGAIGVDGLVATHAPKKKAFYQAMKKVREKYKDVAVLYTGKLIQNPEIPLLWQITHST